MEYFWNTFAEYFCDTFAWYFWSIFGVLLEYFCLVLLDYFRNICGDIFLNTFGLTPVVLIAKIEFSSKNLRHVPWVRGLYFGQTSLRLCHGVILISNISLKEN